jgi:alginate O-acetyltransferase complex protein AlgI
VLFTEPTFLFVFLPLVLGIYFVSPGQLRNWILVVASVIFYARGAGNFTALVLGSIAFNYLAALAIAKRQGTTAARRVLIGTVALNLTVLGLFKYAGFAVGNLNTVMVSLGVQPFAVPEVLLPIGISFFTFHAISYVVDVYRQDATAQKRPLEAALYLLVFPQLIAGPIVRYRQIAAQLTSRVNTTSDFAYGVRRFVIGLSKKMLIANTLAGPADQIFAMAPAEVTAAHAWIAVVCYTLQIYFDFSGYSDMAVGLGRMFGFHFPENFAYPYIASSVQDFWRRWHMSLSAWFRDYVYVPLGGNRTTTARTYFNLVLVFFLCGLWHGASWTFVVWGLFHGAFLVIERVGLARWLARVPAAVRHAYLLLVVMIGWVFFRADTLPASLSMIAAMFGLGGGTAPAVYAPGWYLNREVLLALAAGTLGSTPLVPRLAGWWSQGAAAADQPRLAWVPSVVVVVAVIALFTASLTLSAAQTYNPFIYFRF